MRYKTIFMLTTAIFTASSGLIAQDQTEELARRAQWQARFQLGDTPGAVIRTLEAGTPLYQAGLRVGDQLLSVDGAIIDTHPTWNDITDALTAGAPRHLQVRRGQKIHSFDVTFPPAEKESYPNIEVHYDQITSDYNIKQRVIITKPVNTDGLQPAIFVLQGLSCSSIEYLPGRRSNYIRSLRTLVEKSGMVVMRTEKPGLGDSEGNCSQTDFATEINGYEVALQKLKALPYVDPNRILVYGNSMGSALAPYLANKFNLNAVISDGTFYRSWFEHMLEIERRIKAMQGLDETTINKLINQAYIPLYYGMLIEKKSYAEVITENPLLAEHNYHGAKHMYGRPMSFYHQFQDFDFAGNWQKLEVPVRIRWGTNDWIMSEYDNDMIMEVLTKAGHKDAELYKYPNLDHWSTIHQSTADSFSGKEGVWDDNISDQLIKWAKDINMKANGKPAS